MLKYLLMGVLLLGASASFAQKNFVLTDKTYIVTDKEKSPVNDLASVELQYFIRKTTGLQLPIVHTLPAGKGKAIYVGESSYTKKLKLPTSPLEEQEYLIDITPERVVLLGQDNDNHKADWQNKGRDNNSISPEKDRHVIDYKAITGDGNVPANVTLPSIYDPQGTCYAVYDFAEKYLGVRFYGPHPNNLVFSKNKTIKIPAGNLRRSPALKYRHSTYTFDWPIIKDQYIGATNEMQQLFLRRLRFGGKKWAANHSFTAYQDRFLKKNPQQPELFEAYHPEYFAVGRGGGASERQFCYTNPALIKQVAKDAVDYFNGKGLYGPQVAIGDYFAIVPLDNANWCTCDKCSQLIAMDKENIIGEHFNCGTATHYIWTFINNVAKEVKKQAPGKKLAALAYHVYAYRPEDIQLEDNIVVAPCLHPRNYWAPKMQENEVRFYKSWIEESKQSGREVFLWNYLCFPTERGLVTNFHVFPGFNIHTVGEQIRMYCRDKVQGVFLCGTGEQLDFYITMRLYDNPNLNTDQLISEFFDSYFGNASSAMKSFYTKIESVYENPNNYPDHIRITNAQYHQTKELAWKYLGTEKVMNELADYIDAARKSVRTEDEKQRVDSWITGVWDYMQKGYNDYQTKK